MPCDEIEKKITAPDSSEACEKTLPGDEGAGGHRKSPCKDGGILGEISEEEESNQIPNPMRRTIHSGTEESTFLAIMDRRGGDSESLGEEGAKQPADHRDNGVVMDRVGNGEHDLPLEGGVHDG